MTADVDTIAEDLSSEIANVSNVLRDVSSTVYQNTDKISGLDQDLITLTSSVQAQGSQVEENTQRLDTISDEVSTLSIHGAWCGYQDEWRYKSIITYDTIKFKETNMDITGTPLDIRSGKFTSLYYQTGLFDLVPFQVCSRCPRGAYGEFPSVRSQELRRRGRGRWSTRTWPPSTTITRR